MSDYLANIATRNINQNHGFRFTAGDLRPRPTSHYEPPTAAWSESPGLPEKDIERESSRVDRMVNATPKSSVQQPAEKVPASSVLEITHPSNELDQSTVADDSEALPMLSLSRAARPRSVDTPMRTAALQPPTHLLKSPVAAADARPAPQRDVTIEQRPLREMLAQSGTAQIRPEVHAPIVSRPAAMNQAQQLSPAEAAAIDDQVVEVLQPQPTDSTFDASSVNPVDHDRRSVSHPIVPRRATGSATQHPSLAAWQSTALSTEQPRSATALPQQREVMQQALARVRALQSDSDNEAPVEAPTVNVTIGRIEVRAVPPEARPTSPRTTPAVMTLEEYMQRRASGGG